MTLTERAWELVVASINVTGEDTFALAPENAFEVAKRFEEESAKHEAPKTEGEVWYAVAERYAHDGFDVVSTANFNTKSGAEFLMKEWADEMDDDDCDYFIVEVRRVK